LIAGSFLLWILHRYDDDDDEDDEDDKRDIRGLDNNTPLLLWIDNNIILERKKKLPTGVGGARRKMGSLA
jgi:hypothetical protein